MRAKKLTAQLLESAEEGRANEFRDLVSSGANVNAVDKKRQTPLHLTLRARCTDGALILIELGANVNALDQYDNSPLHLACLVGDYQVVFALLAKNASQSGRNSQNKTPLQCAESPLKGNEKFGNFPACVRLLKSHGTPNMPSSPTGALVATNTSSAPLLQTMGIPASTPPIAPALAQSHSTSALAQSHSTPALLGTRQFGSSNPMATVPPTTANELIQIANQSTKLTSQFSDMANLIAGKDWSAVVSALANSPAAHLPIVATIIKDILGPIAEAQGIAKAVMSVVGTVLDMYLNVRANNVQCQKLGRRLGDIGPALRHLQSALDAKATQLMNAPPHQVAQEALQCRRDVDSLKRPLLTLDANAKAVMNAIDEWRSKGERFFGLVRQMLTAKGHASQFVDLALQMGDSIQALQLCLNTITVLKLDDLQSDLRMLINSASSTALAMREAQQEDKQAFPNQLHISLANDAQFRELWNANFRQIKEQLSDEFTALRDLFSKEFAEVNMKLDVLRSDSANILKVIEKNQMMKEIPWNELEFPDVKLVGQGAYGSVRRAMWGSRECAIKLKELTLSGVGGRLQKELKAEALQLACITSKHVVLLHGVIFEDPHYALVMEFAAPDLSFFLGDVEELPWGQRWTMAYEIAQGLAAVHRAQILHHDLRAANVLVGPKPRVCRLTDFGLAKTKQQSSKNSKTKSGNPIWLSPEYQNASPFTMASDVFSFGVTLFEIAALGGLPFEGRSADVVRQLYQEAKRDTLPLDTPSEFKQLVEMCWHHVPSKRPTSEQVVAYIQGVGSADAKLYV